MGKQLPIKSTFKYTVDLGAQAVQTTFKVKRTVKDRVVNVLLFVFMFVMVGMLVWDVSRQRGIVLDIILLVALALMSIFSLVMPLIVKIVQKKFLKKINIDEMDYTETEINDKHCTETYYKDGKVALQNVCDIRDLMGCRLVDNHLFLIFNNFACAILDVTTLENATLEECQTRISQIIANNKANYPKGVINKK